ncbi:MAG: glycosyltransferase family A protein, partial [Actinomycetota bacterium]|nr:glycosyltransferase family A protein [Actinomycetota bacterium]
MAQIPPGWRFHVVVVDNDVEGSAQQTLDVLGDLGIDITSAVEPRQGIPFARNRTVELAMSLGADLLVFVDDDEWVDKRWLLEFAEALHTYEAPVV